MPMKAFSCQASLAVLLVVAACLPQHTVAQGAYGAYGSYGSYGSYGNYGASEFEVASVSQRRLLAKPAVPSFVSRVDRLAAELGLAPSTAEPRDEHGAGGVLTLDALPGLNHAVLAKSGQAAAPRPVRPTKRRMPAAVPANGIAAAGAARKALVDSLSPRQARIMLQQLADGSSFEEAVTSAVSAVDSVSGAYGAYGSYGSYGNYDV